MQSVATHTCYNIPGASGCLNMHFNFVRIKTNDNSLIRGYCSSYWLYRLDAVIKHKGTCPYDNDKLSVMSFCPCCLVTQTSRLPFHRYKSGTFSLLITCDHPAIFTLPTVFLQCWGMLNTIAVVVLHCKMALYILSSSSTGHMTLKTSHKTPLSVDVSLCWTLCQTDEFMSS